MPFGKYKNHELFEIPANYLEWVLDNISDLDPLLEVAISKEICQHSISPTYWVEDEYYSDLVDELNGLF